MDEWGSSDFPRVRSRGGVGCRLGGSPVTPRTHLANKGGALRKRCPRHLLFGRPQFFSLLEEPGLSLPLKDSRQRLRHLWPAHPAPPALAAAVFSPGLGAEPSSVPCVGHGHGDSFSSPHSQQGRGGEPMGHREIAAIGSDCVYRRCGHRGTTALQVSEHITVCMRAFCAPIGPPTATLKSGL